MPQGEIPPPTTTVSVSAQGFPATPGGLKIPVTLAITPISILRNENPFTPGVFAATLGLQTETFLRGLGPFEPIVTTTGSPVDGEIVMVALGHISILVTFTPPATPMPGLFEASLVLSWEGGTTNMFLTATTAQITATATLIGADGVFSPTLNQETFSLGGPLVNVKIDYISADDAPREIEVNVQSVTTSEVTIGGWTQTTNPSYQKVRFSPLFPPTKEPVPLRSVTAILFATANGSINPKTVVNAKLQVEVPDFPGLTASQTPSPVLTTVPPFTVKE
jgi:hypothetical protein